MSSFRVNLLLLTTSIFAIGGGAAAFAQEGAVEEVVVTGSRITRPGYTAPTPVTSVSTQDLLARAPGNLNELQRDLPQLTVNENSNNNRGFPGSSNPNLRNLGASRTLVLLDGQRLTPSTPQGLLDISSIPTSLISRIDVVTGGASAAYGSDAVAGVMNIFLDTRFEGFKATAQSGQSKYGDYQNYLFSSALGTSFGGGKGHFVVGGEWYENLGVPHTGARAWGRERWAVIPNNAYVAGNTTGQTRLVLVPNVTLAQATDGGVINGVAANSPLRGIQFGLNGTILPFQYGQYFTNASTFHAGVPGDSFAEEINLSAYQKRYGGLANAEYEFSDSVTGFANVMWTYREGRLFSVPNYNSSGATALTIRRDNPFIPKPVADILAANPTITSFAMGRTGRDAINVESSDSPYGPTISTQESLRAIAGLKGEFGEGWQWDAAVIYGNTDYTQEVHNDRIEANYLKAVDAVRDPTTGQAACRVNVDADPNNNDANCVPVNLFGPNAISGAAGRYIYATAKAFGHYERWAASANLQGEVFEMPAGPVALASGVEIRKDNLLSDADPISRALGYRTNNQSRSTGEYTIWEGYVETDVPIIRDAPLAQELSINGAARYTNYSTSGGVTTWKIGANYKPVEDVRFRGVISRDIRAPSLFELFAGASALFNSVNDPVTASNAIVRNVSSGNPDLDPERGTTYSSGVVYQPSWLPRFQVSLDYYKITLKGAIESASSQNIVNFCAAGQTAYCALITRGPGNVLQQVNVQPLNTGSIKTNGWDLDTNYSFDLAGGTLGLRGVVAYTPSRIVTASGISIQNAGSVNTQKWAGNASVTWRNDRLNLLAQVVHVHGGKRDPTYVTGIDINDNHVPSKEYVNVSAGYDVTDNVQIFGKVDNLFDVDPPITPTTVIGQQQVGAAQFDQIGQRWLMGVRLDF